MILFLDFDGVLHPVDCGLDRFTHVEHFERVMRDFPKVDIVISSAWRETHPLEVMRQFFSDDIGKRIIGATPVIGVLTEDGSFHVRQVEIERWLQENGRERESWIALDDTPILFRDGSPNLIRVEPDRAFDAEIERTLRKRLTPAYKSTQLLLRKISAHPR